MTTIRLDADDLADLHNGKVIECTGGPTIKIMLESEGVVTKNPQHIKEDEREVIVMNVAEASNHAQQLTALKAKIVDEVGTTPFLGHRWNDEGFCFNCGEAVSTNQWKQCVSPITLEDVLRSLEGSISDWTLAVARSGGLLKYRYENGWEVVEYPEGWELGKSLDGQSEETISFLFDLLCS